MTNRLVWSFKISYLQENKHKNLKLPFSLNCCTFLSHSLQKSWGTTNVSTSYYLFCLVNTCVDLHVFALVSRGSSPLEHFALMKRCHVGSDHDGLTGRNLWRDLWHVSAWGGDCHHRSEEARRCQKKAQMWLMLLNHNLQAKLNLD